MNKAVELFNTTGIFEITQNGDSEYTWVDFLDEYEAKEAKYFVEMSKQVGNHISMKSALYEDVTDYKDKLQGEQNLSDDELYVVLYNEFEETSFGLLEKVDFGITKEQIIENVKSKKYIEGAHYFTMGQMFYTTKMILEKMAQ